MKAQFLKHSTLVTTIPKWCNGFELIFTTNSSFLSSPFQLLLSLAKSLFQEQMSLEGLVSTIIKQAKEMLNCERCTVYLLDLKAYNAVRIKLKPSLVPFRTFKNE